MVLAKQFGTPILYVAFNRPDVVRKTFPLIAAQKPKTIFIAIDGPRNKEEKFKTEEVKNYVKGAINWKCVVKTRFLEKNLGCAKAVSSAIDWFLSEVEEGIILEDDCVPNESFFRFSEEMLRKYKNNPRVFSVNGYNYLGRFNVKESYYFSKYFNCIGWSTWSDRWFARDRGMKRYLQDLKTGKFQEVIKNPIERIWIKKKFSDGIRGLIGAWDHSFGYHHYREKGLCVKPRVNLLGNIGFMKDSTHTSGNFIDNKFYCLKTEELEFPLVHPKKVELNEREARMVFWKTFTRLFLKRLFRL